MAFRLATSTQQAACNPIVSKIDTGGTSTTTGQIKFYTGSQPTDPQTAVTGTLLATLNFNNPSFNTANSSGQCTMITSSAVTGSVSNSGTPGCFRVFDRGGNPVFDGSVTINGSGGDITFDNVTWVSGGVATLSGLTITVPM